MLDSGKALGFPDGLLINGRSWNGYTFTVEPGKPPPLITAYIFPFFIRTLNFSARVLTD